MRLQTVYECTYRLMAQYRFPRASKLLAAVSRAALRAVALGWLRDFTCFAAILRAAHALLGGQGPGAPPDARGRVPVGIPG